MYKCQKNPLHQRFQMSKILTHSYSELLSRTAHCSTVVKKNKKIKNNYRVSFFFFFFSSLSPFFSMLFVSLFLIATIYLTKATASLALFNIALAHPARSPHRLFKITSPEPPQASPSSRSPWPTPQARLTSSSRSPCQSHRKP